jgi:hypothetical protein
LLTGDVAIFADKAIWANIINIATGVWIGITTCSIGCRVVRLQVVFNRKVYVDAITISKFKIVVITGQKG